jgi:hypothetical protein
MSVVDNPPSWFRGAMLLPRSELRKFYDADLPREPGWREGPNLKRQSDYAWALENFGHGSELMDPGIIRVVRLLQEAGVETCQSCQGGEGHAYEWPAVDVTHEPWKALDVANGYGIPVSRIAHTWNIDPDRGEPYDASFWRIAFEPRRLARCRERWYDGEENDRQEYNDWVAANPTA